MNDELLELQTQLSFQEDSVQQLNDVVTRHQDDIDTLRQEVDMLKQQIQLLISNQLDGVGEEAPPPHY